MPFPSEAYIKECNKPEVAKKLREEWRKYKPCLGDICLIDNVVTLVSQPYGYGFALYALFSKETRRWSWDPAKHGYGQIVPLFRLDQLIEMLEERGYRWKQEKMLSREVVNWGVLKEDIYMALIWGEKQRGIREFGPDPVCALLKAWLEATEKGGVG